MFVIILKVFFGKKMNFGISVDNFMIFIISDNSRATIEAVP